MSTRYALPRHTPGAGLKEHESQIDMRAMRAYRLNRVREQLITRDYGACVLFNPYNIRYATGARNLQVFSAHSPGRYLFLPVDGPVILFDPWIVGEWPNPVETIDEFRPATRWTYYSHGPRFREQAKLWASEIADLVNIHCRANQRFAIDRIDPEPYEELKALGVEQFWAQEALEHARVIKCPEEIACMSISVSVCDAGLYRMRESLRPGLTENELWATFIQTCYSLGAESVEMRLLSSGGRTNPWHQECGDRLIRCGDLVLFDSDMVGPFGYYADISRTFHCGPGSPSGQQRKLYQMAYEEIQHNIALFQPGATFKEISEKAYKAPDEFLPYRDAVAHGVGVTDEYPMIQKPMDWDVQGYDGVVEENMTLCVESYMGVVGGSDGVKLEEQIVITSSGPQLLSTFPFEEDLLKDG